MVEWILPLRCPWRNWYSTCPSKQFFLASIICLVCCEGVTNASLGSVFPYPSMDTYSMVDYAHFNNNCVDQTLSLFLQFVPFILLLQVGRVIVMMIIVMIMI